MSARSEDPAGAGRGAAPEPDADHGPGHDPGLGPQDSAPTRGGERDASAATPEARGAAGPEGDGGPPGPAPRLLLTVDDAGQYLLVAAREVVVGHARTRTCDLPFLADVGGRHARLSRRETLHGGASWRVESLQGEAVLVNGRPVGKPARLIDGDEVQLGANLAFAFRVPDPASSSAVLDFLHGAECLGAGHALLVAPGDAGRVRIGAAGGRHVRVVNVLHGVTLTVEGERLLVRCEAGVTDGAGSPREAFSMPFPPPQRVDLSIGGSVDGRPPFGLILAPVDDPGLTSRDGA